MSHSGPLLDTVFLAHLSRAIHTFLPGAQINSAIEILLQRLKDAWESYDENDHAIHGEGPRNKRKVGVDAASSLDSGISAISFSLSARVALVVVSSLAMKSVPQTAQGEVGRILSDLKNSFLFHRLTKTFGTIQSRAGSDAWSSQIVAAASLHLLYALDIFHDSFLQTSGYSELWMKISDSLEDDRLLPELTVEIVCIPEYKSCSYL